MDRGRKTNQSSPTPLQVDDHCTGVDPLTPAPVKQLLHSALQLFDVQALPTRAGAKATQGGAAAAAASSRRATERLGYLDVHPEAELGRLTAMRPAADDRLHVVVR